MDGRAMDANNQVGSGGVNSPASTPFLNSANLFVTGNVTAGRAFQGFSPIRSSSSLLLGLPSSRLSTFQRDSYGLGPAPTYPYSTAGQINPFFDPSSSVTSVGGIVAGQNLPGSSVPLNSYALPTGNPLGYTSGGVGAVPYDLGYSPSAATTAVPNSSIYTLDNLDLLRNKSLSEQLRLSAQTQALQGSLMFGSTVSESRPLVPESSSRIPSLPDPYAFSTRSVAAQNLDPFVRQSRTIGDASSRPSSEDMLANAQRMLSPTSLAPRLFDETLTEVRRDPLTGRPVPTERTFAAIPADRDLDPVAARDLPTQTAPTLTQAAPPFGQTIPIVPPPDEEQGLAALPSAAAYLEAVGGAPEPAEAGEGEGANVETEGYQRAIDIIRSTSARSLSSFTEGADERVAGYIARAEAELRKGSYYQAASLYRLAASSMPEDGLVRLGYAHALVAAGEYRTAVMQLTQAIESYPAFAYLNFDLNKFIADVKILDVRRADLERRLENKEDYNLRFMLGYLEYYSGLPQFGLPNLRKAAADAPADSVIARFPEMLDKAKKLQVKSEE